ncbi:hypothetical protein F5Y06DRAFT_267705 [Hypoxylon sp. FL0890]|nr:hypothetical protein F5Y06DRAFT_267705 [Hypoxylon sp. FL0890]
MQTTRSVLLVSCGRIVLFPFATLVPTGKFRFFFFFSSDNNIAFCCCFTAPRVASHGVWFHCEKQRTPTAATIIPRPRWHA